MDTSIIPYLAGATFALAIAYALYQWWRAAKARKEHHRSASAVANGSVPGWNTSCTMPA